MTYPLRQDFSGSVAVVTGATAGIGQAIAESLLQAGAKVIATGRRSDKLQALADAYPAQVLPLTLDITDKAAVEKAFTTLPADFAAVDILVNNAGLALGLEGAPEASLDDWETMVDTNIKGVLYATRTLLPDMIARGRGHVVNLGSIAGNYPYPGGNVYGATKAFIKQLSLNLRADLLGTPVRVTNIEPGIVETEFSKVRFKGDDARADSVYADTTPLYAEDIAQTIFWSLSLPAHVNINRLEIMPVSQASSALNIYRKKNDISS